MPYPVVASGWHDFYILAGTAAATLVGLLFVGLSLHLRIVVASSEVRSLARVTLANFGAILFVALFMVIPQDRSTAAVELIASRLPSLIIPTPSPLAVIRGWLPGRLGRAARGGSAAGTLRPARLVSAFPR